MTIAVCIPSRGMMHSRTMDDVLKTVRYAQLSFPAEYIDTQFIFSHGRPQPEAENYLIEEALKVKPTYIWVIDDDMAFPETILVNILIMAPVEVVVAHYPCTAHGNDALHIRDGKFESAGMGCVFIRPEVFEKLSQPYFRCDTQYVWNGEKLEGSPVPANHTPESIHGLHDVDFFQRLLKAGIEPEVVETNAGQYNLLDQQIKKYGNHTQQNVEEWWL